jgi:hypothetical protein
LTLSADEAVVARLLEVISGDAPMAEAERLLAPDVISHMDEYTVRGIAVWVDWVEFLRSRARGDVKVELDRLVTGPDGRITAFGWLRIASAPDRTPQPNQAIYRLKNRLIAEVWTTRGNYEMIFGAKVRHRFSWMLVLLEMAVWRRLPWKSSARSSRLAEPLDDGRRNEPGSGGQAHGRPERSGADRERGGVHGH